jgi:hypothetical protein
MGNRVIDPQGGNRDYRPSDLLKVAFPKFQGAEPKIWFYKCLDCYNIYQVPEFLWLSFASLHMEGNARWVREYKRSQGLGNRAQFTQADQEKFGAEEDSQAMRDLLQLTQRSSLEEYIHAFEEAKYVNTLHSPGLGETFFVSQFVKGLKGEL